MHSLRTGQTAPINPSLPRVCSCAQVSVVDELGVPVKFVGVGEGMPFAPRNAATLPSRHTTSQLSTSTSVPGVSECNQEVVAPLEETDDAAGERAPPALLTA